MPPELLLCGDFAPTIGGQFERTTLESLRDALPPQCVLIGALNLPTHGGEFYDYDVIVAGVGVCVVLELKCVRPEAVVFEDCIRGINGFSLDRVFSILNNKARVLAGRMGKAPFVGPVPRVESYVVVPDGVRLEFRFADHRTNTKVMSVGDVVRFLRGRLQPGARGEFAQVGERWRRYAHEMQAPGIRTAHSIGRFKIKKTLVDGVTVRDYQAVDELPCDVDVHLREFAYDPLRDAASLREELERLSREMRTLRGIRHPNVACVIGHFQTGTSLVQVSDWFEGHPLDSMWSSVGELSLVDKAALITTLCDALGFCHQSGIFHRDVRSGNVVVADNLADLRLGGFGFARNLALSSSLSASELSRRIATVVTPEELPGGREFNPRLADIFQAGVLFYSVIENGAVPFENSLDLCTGGSVRSMQCHAGETGVEKVREIVSKMIAADPRDRPQLMEEIAGTVRGAVSS